MFRRGKAQTEKGNNSYAAIPFKIVYPAENLLPLKVPERSEGQDNTDINAWRTETWRERLSVRISYVPSRVGHE